MPSQQNYNENYMDFPGTSRADTLENYGSYVTVEAGNGDDVIISRASVEGVEPRGFNVIDGGGGNDNVTIDDDFSSVFGGKGNDYIVSSGNLVTINGGKGNDTIVGSTLSSEIYQIKGGEGKDLIYGFDSNDTIQITKGKLSKSVKSGNDISFKIGSGQVTLKNAANGPIQILTVDGELIVLHPELNSINNTKNRQALVGDGIDSIVNTGSDVTIGAGDGNDTIVNFGANANINAGDDDDVIFNFGADMTLEGGKGNDTFVSGAPAEVFRFGANDGVDVIYNISADDTIQLTSGSITESIVSGDDVIVAVGENASINLKHAADVNFNIIDPNGAPITVEPTGKYIVNREDDQTLVGTEYDDTIENYSGHRVVISAGDENDIVRNTDGRNALIELGAGDDFLNNSSGDYATISAGDGNDSINNSDGYWTTIDGGAGNDFIVLNDSEEVTVRAGLGNDTVVNRGGTNNIYEYADGDGNDVIDGFEEDDTFSVVDGTIGGSQKSGDDVIVTVGSGTVTFKNIGDIQIQTIVDGEDVTLNPELTTIENSDADNVINGTEGKDHIVNGAASSEYSTLGLRTTVNALGDDDTIENYGHQAVLNGNNGAEYIRNYAAFNVSIDGGAGDDTIYNSGSFASINGGADNDTIYNSAGYASIAGGAGADTIYSEGQNNVINGGEGADDIDNRGDYSTVVGGADDDVIRNYGAGASINGGSGADSIISYGTNATLEGGGGNDTLTGSSNADVIVFGTGGGVDVVTNFGSNDTLKISSGAISGSTVDGNDVIINVGSDSIRLQNMAIRPINAVDADGNSTVLNDNPLYNSSIPSDALYYGGHYYYIYKDVADTWEDAESFAESLDGHLAVINDDAENTALYDYMTALGYESAYFGLSDADSEGTWTWVDGTPLENNLDNAHWGIDIYGNREPNGGTNENYGMYYRDLTYGNEAYTWNDSSYFQAGETSFIVEWESGLLPAGQYIHNTSADTIITGTAYDDTVYNEGKDVYVELGAGNDSILTDIHGYSYENVTVDGGSGDDTIQSNDNRVSLAGGEGNDYVSTNGWWSGVTLNGGKGDDTIYGAGYVDGYSDSYYGKLIQYAVGDGNDLVRGFGRYDTLQLIDATIDGTLKNGNDYIITVGDGSITLEGAAEVPINIMDTDGTVETINPDINIINNTVDNTLLVGIDGRDSIYNSGGDVTIDSSEGNDTINNVGANVSIGSAGGTNIIYNAGENATIRSSFGDDQIFNTNLNANIDAGDGNDQIQNSGGYAVINAGGGDDSISLLASNTTLRADEGDDYIALSTLSSDNVIEYGDGDGNDTITGFNADDTIRISAGEYSTATSDDGNDFIIAVGDGSITIKDVADVAINIIDAEGMRTRHNVDRPEPTIPADALNYNGHYYYVFDAATSRQAAADYAYSLGGAIATADDTAEAAAIDNLIAASGFDSAYYVAADGTLPFSSVYVVEWDEGTPSTVATYITNTTANSLVSGSNDREIMTNSSNGTGATLLGLASNDSVTNYGGNAVIDLGLGADYIYNDGNYATVYGGGGNDRIRNNKHYVYIDAGAGHDYINTDIHGATYEFVTVDGGAGNDTIYSNDHRVSLNGGDGNDSIYTNAYWSGVTLRGGAGDDTINTGSNAYYYSDSTTNGKLIQYADGDGNDIITTFNPSDTIQILSGAIGSGSLNGSDIILKVGSGSLTLKNTTSTNVQVLNADGSLVTLTNDYFTSTEGLETISNEESLVITGTERNDTIRNGGADVTINALGGDDYIENYYGAEHAMINAGAGNDTVDNGGDFASINGGAGDDSIVVSGERATADGGAGNDVIDISDGYSAVVQYRAGDGDDTVVGYDTNKTLQVVAGEYTTQRGGGDFILNFDSGTLVVKGAEYDVVTIFGTNDVGTIYMPSIVTVSSADDYADDMTLYQASASEAWFDEAAGVKDELEEIVSSTEISALGDELSDEKSPFGAPTAVSTAIARHRSKK